MKKAICMILIAITLLSIGLPVSVSGTVYQGLTFTNTDTYRTSRTTLDLPATYEATVYFLPSTAASTRGGVIFGCYSTAEKSCFSFEIYKNGHPRIYIIDDTQTAHNIIFTNVNVYTGEPSHITITVDWAKGIYRCYLNGQLKQTIKDNTFSPFQMTDTFCLGGDLRDNNDQHFKGAIQKVSLYSDIRSDLEIASDAQSAAFDTDGLLAAYDLTSFTFGSKPAVISTTKGPELTYAELQTWLPEAPAVQEYDYSFALVGDIQSLTWYFPDKLPKIFDWLTANAQKEKIAHVFHLGDITDRNTEEEWTLAKAQYDRLNGIVPYTFIRGNHDGIEEYNTYMRYADYASTVDGSFDESMLNTYKKFTAGGIKYLVVNLDLAATNEVLDWANLLVAQHPDYNVIVTTHIYLSAAGKHTTYLKYDASNTGQQIWDKFVSLHKNIVMVFCGHSSTDQIMLTRSTGIHGNEVVQILVDPQNTDIAHDATGLVAMLYFSDGGKHVDVRYYSTVKDQYFLSTNQFSFDVHTLASNDPTLDNGTNSTTPSDGPTKDTISPGYKIAIIVIAILLAVEAVVLIILLRRKRKTAA